MFQDSMIPQIIMAAPERTQRLLTRRAHINERCYRDQSHEEHLEVIHIESDLEALYMDAMPEEERLHRLEVAVVAFWDVMLALKNLHPMDHRHVMNYGAKQRPLEVMAESCARGYQSRKEKA